MSRFNANTINLKAGLDASGVATGVQKIEGYMGQLNTKIGGLSKKFSMLGNAIAGAFAVGAVGSAIQSTVNAASDLNETVSKTEQIFGSSANEIKKFAETAAESLGLSQRAAMDGAATFATFGKAAGLSGSELAKFSTDLLKLSADLASFYNTSPEDAIIAIGAALRGESEPIRRYGVLLDDATLRQVALKNGITDTIKTALTPQQKALAANLAIFQQTTDAQGDFARTSDGLANSTRIFNAQLEDMKAILGRDILPMLTSLLKKLTPAMKDLMTYGRAAFGTMASSDIRALERRDAAIAKIQSTEYLQRELNKAQEEYNKLVESQSFAITNAEYRERIAFKSRINAMQEEYDRRVEIYNQTISQIGVEKKLVDITSTTPLSPEQEAKALKEKIQNTKELNKELSSLAAKGLSEAQVKSLDTALALNFLSTAFGALPEKLEQVNTGFENLKPAMSDTQQRMSDMLEEMNRMLDSFVKGAMVELFTRLGEGMFGAARDVEDWGNKMIASFGGFLQQMGAMIMSYGFAMDAFKKAFKRPEVAIAAGAALIVLGSGIKAMHENKMNGGAGVSSSVPVSSDLGGYNFTGRVDGYDLVLVTDRNQRLMNRRG